MEGACSDTVRSLACEILDMYENGRIYLKPEHFDSRGNNPYDGAASISNIRDTCRGHMAKRLLVFFFKKKCLHTEYHTNCRSSYENAPGGCTCLHSSMLDAMIDYANEFYNTYGLPIEINAIAGSSHSVNSWHYEGNTMDISCTTPLDHCVAIEDFCRDRGAIELCYPGSSCGGHETWVHCAMPLD